MHIQQERGIQLAQPGHIIRHDHSEPILSPSGHENSFLRCRSETCGGPRTICAHVGYT